MKKLFLCCTAFLSLWVQPFFAQKAVVEKIIEIGHQDNQATHQLDILTNRFGGRPIGSDAYENAAEWMVHEYKKWGLDVHLEEAGELSVGFNRGPWFGKLLSHDHGMTLHFATPSYTSGTKGVQRGHVLMEPHTDQEFKRIKLIDFASDSFAHLFGYNPTWIKTIKQQGDLLEERIHPDDRIQLTECQIEHGQFIYSLPPEERNDYRQIFQFRMLNARQQYINVSSRQQVIETDRNGKAWIIMGVMDILPDQTPIERIKRTVVNRKTGEMLPTCTVSPDKQLSNREKEILRLIRQGFLSKEIAHQLGVSIYTVNNHRKNILSKLDANNIMEAIHIVENLGIYL